MIAVMYLKQNIFTYKDILHFSTFCYIPLKNIYSNHSGVLKMLFRNKQININPSANASSLNGSDRNFFIPNFSDTPDPSPPNFKETKDGSGTPLKKITIHCDVTRLFPWQSRHFYIVIISENENFLLSPNITSLCCL
jgi:hypothetical protein